MSQASPTMGIVIVASQFPHYLELARACAASVREHASTVPGTIFTDMEQAVALQGEALQQLPAHGFATRNWGTDQLLKIAALIHSPYQRTLYLDADTLVRSGRIVEIFDDLDSHDWCSMIADKALSRSARLQEEPIFHTGVIALRTNPAVKQVLQAWLEAFDTNLGILQSAEADALSDTQRFLLSTDQYALSRVLPVEAAKPSLKIRELKSLWNYTGRLNEEPAEVIISHSPEIRAAADPEKQPLSELGIRQEFASPLLLKVLAKDPEFLGELATEIRGLTRANYSDDYLSGSGGARTQGDIFKSGRPQLKRLRDLLVPEISRYVSALIAASFSAPKDNNVNVEINGWAYVLQAGDYLAPHVHRKALVAGSFYIKVPTDEEGGGSLILHSPLASHMMMDGPLEPKTSLALKVEPGMLVLFPAYLLHSVTPFRSGERIVISFNVGLSAPDSEAQLSE